MIGFIYFKRRSRFTQYLSRDVINAYPQALVLKEANPEGLKDTGT